MDIRNFFGNKKAKNTSTASPATSTGPSPSLPKKTEEKKIEAEENRENVEEKVVEIGDKETSSEDVTDSNLSVVSQSTSSAPISSPQKLKPSSSPPSLSSDLTCPQKISPDLQAIITWKPNEPVPYSAVAAAFDKIASTSSRLEKESALCKLYRAVIVTTPQDLEPVVYLTSNVVYPAYEGFELGIGDALLIKAVVDATGRNRAAVQAAYKSDGDLGTVACQSRSSQSTLTFGQKPKPLTARFVLEQLRAITQISGSKSMDRKVGIIKKMMVSCQGDEAKYIVRALQGKLRIGTAAQTVLVGLAHAFAVPPTLSITSTETESSDQQIAVKSSPDEEEEEEEENMDLVDSEDDGEAPVTRKKSLRLKGSNRLISVDDDDEEEEEEEDGELRGEKIESIEETTIELKKEIDSVSKEKEKESDDQMELVVNNSSKKIPSSIPELSFDFIDDTNLFDVIEAVPMNPPTESIQLNTTKKLTKEKRNELAVIAVKRAFSECPSLTVLINSLLINQNCLQNLYQYCKLTPGVPVAPMLAKPTKQVAEVLKRLSGQLFTMEYKYDGERAQIHLLDDGTIKIFSRNSEDNSLKYPEFLDVIRRSKKDGIVSCVIDAEVVAYDREKKCLLPFQILSTRKRKVEEGSEEEQKVQVILQAFDLIFLNGKSLLKEPFLFRRTLLHNSFIHREGYFHFASGLDHHENGDTTPIEIFMQEACHSACEGLMVKTLVSNATYEPSKRSLNWLKLKKDYINGMGVCDSVDLVVMGGYHGRGKRTNVYGAYLMACYDPENDEYQSVCKVGTGFKDEDLIRLTEEMKNHIVSTGKKPSNYNVGDPLTPDDWFEPSIVWELQAADLSKSSVHRGAVDSSGRGIGLRFPRYLRDRTDKKPEMATTCEQIMDMYQSQGEMVDPMAEGEDEDEDII